MDWSTKGKVQRVKDQSSCGSCWAFGTNAALESAAVIISEGAKLEDLSEQELVDCTNHLTSPYSNYGCGGGWHYTAYTYIKDKNGLSNNKEYPYHAKDETCSPNLAARHNRITGYSYVKKDNGQLKAFLEK